MMKYKFNLFIILFYFFSYAEASADEIFLREPALVEFIDMMVIEHGYTKKEMVAIFTKAKYIETPAKSSDKPAEALDWIAYRTRMINDLRIKQGIRYYKKNRLNLRTAESIYGVPDHIIAGILGIETNYGMFKLRYRAVDCLASLAFFYPRRAPYFKKELEALLVYAKKQKTDPFSYLSSYAGAIGIPQFMPSNILAYAVDANRDGVSDIINNHQDAIHSVGNFLKSHNWQKGVPVITEVTLKGLDYKPLVSQNPCGKDSLLPLTTLKNAGVIFPIKTNNKWKASLFSLDTDEEEKFYVAFENFCAIYKYNPSLRYAMVVDSLGSSLGKIKLETQKKPMKQKTPVQVKK